jgi:hypothetical protein
MDLKILAAVFTSLAAVFIVINAGGLGGSGPGIGGLIPEFFSPEAPEPETGVTAEIEVLTENTTMNVNGNVTVEGLTQYGDIKSQNDIEFKYFDGDVRIGNGSMISGNAEGFTSSGVQVARNFELERELNTTQVDIEGADRVALEFEKADIDLEATNSSSGIQETNTSVGIQSFSGNITVRPDGMTLSLEGNVSRVEAGQTTFGAN